MEIIKKHLNLIIVVAISIIGSVVLLYLSFTKYGEIDGSNDKITNARERMKSLISAETKAVEENRKSIIDDEKELSKRVQAIKDLYGHPYYTLRPVLVTSLNIKLDDLKPLWNDFCKKNLELSKKDIAKTLFDFLKLQLNDTTETHDKVVLLYDKVGKELSKLTLAKCNAELITEAILEALDTPMDIAQDTCKFKIDASMEAIKQMFSTEEVVATPTPSYYFVFDEYRNKFPPEKTWVPHLLSQLLLVEDIARRVKDAKLTKIVEMTRQTPVAPSSKKQIVMHEFTIVVEGEFVNIRRFVNMLNEAYKLNHFYHVRDFSCFRTNELEKEVLSPTKKEEKKSVNTDDELVIEIEKSVVPLFGGSTMVRATIRFDYPVFSEKPEKK